MAVPDAIMAAGGLGLNPTSIWRETAGKSSRRVKTFKANAADVRARYGPSAAIAAAMYGSKPSMMDARLADDYWGSGRYARKLRSYGKRMYGRRKSHRKYGGRGLYTGSGGFMDMWRNSGDLRSRLGAGFKAAAGAMGGQKYADALTTAEGYGRALGMGAYTVANDIVDGGAGQEIPSFSSGPTSVLISHKEYISDVFGPATSGSFQNTPYSLNPGIERTFPWLSQVAANYEEYTLKQCIFTFRSTVTDFVATNGQVGTIIMATQYNPSDAPFASKQDAMEYDAAMSGKVSANMLHGVECDPAQLSGAPGKYVRSGPVRSDDDLKQYDWGNLNVCISNIPSQFANQALGELWVSYTIELRKPKFFVSRGLNILRDAFVAQTSLVPPLGENIWILPTGTGSQNRIGGLLTQDTVHGTLNYTFPATFSGSVVVKLTCTRGTPIVGTNGWVFCTPKGNNVGFASATTTTLGGTFDATSAIRPINDVWVADQWAPMVSGSDGGVGDTYAIFECHLNVASPTTAAAVPPALPQDNVLVFQYMTAFNGLPLAGVVSAGFQLDVAVYNTQFNYPASGNLIVTNPITGLQEAWP